MNNQKIMMAILKLTLKNVEINVGTGEGISLLGNVYVEGVATNDLEINSATGEVIYENAGTYVITATITSVNEDLWNSCEGWTVLYKTATYTLTIV